MMTMVLVHACCVGGFPSRRIQNEMIKVVPLRFLGAGHQPDFRTISDFHKIHRKALQGLFQQVLRLALEAGGIRVCRVALDGTKIKLYRTGRLLPKKTRKSLKKSTYLIDKVQRAAWVPDLGGGASVGGITVNPWFDRAGRAYSETVGNIVPALSQLNGGAAGRVVRWAEPRKEDSC
jgi:hypothetical protein